MVKMGGPKGVVKIVILGGKRRANGGVPAILLKRLGGDRGVKSYALPGAPLSDRLTNEE